MSMKTTHGRNSSFGLIMVILLTIISIASLCVLSETALGQDISDGNIPEGVFSLISQAKAADHLVSTIEKDLSVVNTHPEATPDERYALKNILEIARVELYEAEKTITDTLSNYYDVDVSIIENIRNSGKSWEAIVAALENGNLFNTPNTRNGADTGGLSTGDGGEEPYITVASENPTGTVAGSPSEKGKNSWGYGLDRYTAENGRNNNSNGNGGGGATGGVGGTDSGNDSGNNGVGGGVGGGKEGNRGSGSSGNNGVGGGVGGGKEGNRGRGSN